MSVLTFPDRTALWYPNRYPGVDDEYTCLLVSPPLVAGGRTLLVPGATHEEAAAFVQAIDDQPEGLTLSKIGDGFQGLKASGALFERMVDIRTNYLRDLDTIGALWVDNDMKVDPKIARLFVGMRDAARQNARQLSGMPNWSYQLIDKLRPGKSRAHIEELLAAGKYEDVIDKSMRPNRRLDHRWIRTAKTASKLLKRAGSLGTVVTAIEIGDDVVDMFNAQTDSEMDAALHKFKRTAVTAATSNVTAFAGGYVGAALCVVLGLSTGGIAVIAMGVAGGIAGGIYGGHLASQIAAHLIQPKPPLVVP